MVPKIDDIGGIEGQKFCVGHGGGAVGASSILFILPDENFVQYDENNNEIAKRIPRGVLVTVLTNLENVSCLDLAYNVAKIFGET